jgi:sugar phosphate isomerase/epimerase
MYSLGINFDEISDDLSKSLIVMQGNGVKNGELRTIDGKNFVFWDDEYVETFKKKIHASGIELVAAATPLFKWYGDIDDPEIVHDSFGFNPRLTEDEKKRIIDRTISIASRLSIPRLRIFSGLGNSKNSGTKFGESKLLEYALGRAEESNIDLYLENEPVCKVHTKSEIISLFDLNTHPRLKLWLDIANLVEVGEGIDEEFIKKISDRLGYLHVKDFISKDKGRTYVPAGKGEINYVEIMKLIYAIKPDNIVVTVETHALKDKIEMSISSIKGTRKILNEAGVKYE